MRDSGDQKSNHDVKGAKQATTFEPQLRDHQASCFWLPLNLELGPQGPVTLRENASPQSGEIRRHRSCQERHLHSPAVPAGLLQRGAPDGADRPRCAAPSHAR